jgi:hypothetical protein
VLGGGIGANNGEPYTLATGILTAFTLTYDNSYGQPLAVAYATILLAMFFVLAAAATALQGGRAGWIPGRGA